MSFSICIPCYEMHGKGLKYLKRLMQSIFEQSKTDWEVIISDDSVNTDIKDYTLSLNDDRIKYVKNESGKKVSSANINNAIKHSTKRIIKPIFQDDFIKSKRALEDIELHVNTSERLWGATGFIHTDAEETSFFRYMFPSLNNSLLSGVNTIGCPSNIFFLRECNIFFDENLKWLMDCEFYYRLNKCSYPLFINFPLMVTRIWDESVSNEVTNDEKMEELTYVLRKHNVQS